MQKWGKACVDGAQVNRRGRGRGPAGEQSKRGFHQTWAHKMDRAAVGALERPAPHNSGWFLSWLVLQGKRMHAARRRTMVHVQREKWSPQQAAGGLCLGCGQGAHTRQAAGCFKLHCLRLLLLLPR